MNAIYEFMTYTINNRNAVRHLPKTCPGLVFGGTRLYQVFQRVDCEVFLLVAVLAREQFGNALNHLTGMTARLKQSWPLTRIPSKDASPCDRIGRGLQAGAEAARIVVLAAVFAVLTCLVATAPQALARDIVNAPFEAVSINILDVSERVQSSANETDVEAAPDVSGNVSAMRLSARSQGPIYRWLVFSIRNSSPIPLEYVVVSQRSSFVESGVIWPEFAVRQLLDGQASPGLPPTPEVLNTADGFSFRIDSNQTVTYALEVAGAWPDNLQLWQRSAFEKQRQQVAFFSGLLLGIAALVAIYISSLFIIRRKLVFPSAALFAWSGVAFLGIEFGYLGAIVDLSPIVQFKVRAAVETAMAVSLFASLYTFVELRKRMPVLGYLTLLAILGAIATFVYGFTEPWMAAGIARMSILAGALFGLFVILVLSRRGVIRAQVAVSGWVLIAVWTVVAGLAALGILSQDVVGPGLAAGLVLVNLMIAFTVTQYAFDSGVISSRFFEDSGRRALALAGSEQCVWDWREDQGWLFIGQELEKLLGVQPGTLTTGGLKAWLELMHPGDRPAYVAAVEAAIQRGRGTFSQEFRLRRKDGTYRWFQLRARAIPGEQGRASRCIGTLVDITTFKRSEERLLYDAVQDRLTGLPNRALFIDRLDRAMRRAGADDAVKLYVGVIDIDRFKNVNDGLGHSIGDSLLLTMARRLEKSMRAEDTLSRLSGDQFGIIVNAARPERDIREMADTLREAIAQPVNLNPREVFLTASLGFSEISGDMAKAEDVLKDAEIALYEAKRRGKNKIEFFRPDMRDDRSKLIEIESDLRRALERNEIEVVYQPIYDLESAELAGFEALVRWRHRRHGLLEPEEFIGVAEETGIIVDVGRHVAGEAARQLGIWQRVLRPAHPIFVSVNLSGRQVLDQNLIDDIKTIIAREDVTPGSLKLELTETMVMENVELSAQVLQRLKDLGVSILCDDFGTGYSSLAILQRLPFDTLKLDRSFVHSEQENETASVILETIILLAHDLGMKVVAEGIEEKHQLDRLREFECDFGQGFYFGEPLSARAVIEALGGKPSMLDTKRGKGKGLFGRLLRSSTQDDERAPRAPAEEPSVLKTDKERPVVRDAVVSAGNDDQFKHEAEARRLERLRQPTISAIASDGEAEPAKPEEGETPEAGDATSDPVIEEETLDTLFRSRVQNLQTSVSGLEDAGDASAGQALAGDAETQDEASVDLDATQEKQVEADGPADGNSPDGEARSSETLDPPGKDDGAVAGPVPGMNASGEPDAGAEEAAGAGETEAMVTAQTEVSMSPPVVEPSGAGDDKEKSGDDEEGGEPPVDGGSVEGATDGATGDEDTGGEGDDPEQKLEELASGKHKTSKLSKLLRRGRRRHPVLES